MTTYTVQTTKKFLPTHDESYLLGIDPGTKNGFSIYNRRTNMFEYIRTVRWWDLIDILEDFHTICHEKHCSYEVIIEDIIGNKITFQRGMIFAAAKTNNMQEIAKAIGIFDKRAQDVGGNKRDEQHLLDWFEKNNITIHKVVPKKNSKTKLDADAIEKLTGITSRTSPHSRDSITLIWNFLHPPTSKKKK